MIKLVVPKDIYLHSMAMEIDPRKVDLLKQLLDIIPDLTIFTVIRNSKNGYNYTIDVLVYGGYNEPKIERQIFLSSIGSNFAKDYGISFELIDNLYKKWSRDEIIESVLT